MSGSCEHVRFPYRSGKETNDKRRLTKPTNETGPSFSSAPPSLRNKRPRRYTYIFYAPPNGCRTSPLRRKHRTGIRCSTAATAFGSRKRPPIKSFRKPIRTAQTNLSHRNRHTHIRSCPRAISAACRSSSATRERHGNRQFASSNRRACSSAASVTFEPLSILAISSIRCCGVSWRSRVAVPSSVSSL